MKSQTITPRFDLDAPLGDDPGSGRLPAGVICAANEARFTAGHFSEQLTGYSVGWTDPEQLDQVLQRLNPAVLVGRRFDFKKANNAQAFLSETDDLRPIGSPFKTVEYTGVSASDKTHNRGLSMRIDFDEYDDVEAAVTQGVGLLRQRLNRNALRRLFTLLDAIDTASGDSAWTAESNPDGLLRALGKVHADAVGLYPNVWAIGEVAWNLRLDSYEAPGRVNGQNRANYTPAQLAQYLMADTVEVVKARFQSTATAKAAVLSARVYAYLAYQGAGKDDPSAVKRFVSSTRGGGNVAVYREDHDKFTEISVEHYENQVATGIGVQSLDATDGS